MWKHPLSMSYSVNSGGMWSTEGVVLCVQVPQVTSFSQNTTLCYEHKLQGSELCKNKKKGEHPSLCIKFVVSPRN
jgi:hypothetical protein